MIAVICCTHAVHMQINKLDDDNSYNCFSILIMQHLGTDAATTILNTLCTLCVLKEMFARAYKLRITLCNYSNL